MKAQPIPKKLMDDVLETGATKLVLAFRGGSDEGYLDIALKDEKGGHIDTPEALEERLTDWVWEVYDYGGAGDGNDYGDDIEYDFAKKRVSTSEWTMQRTEGDENTVPMDVAK